MHNNEQKFNSREILAWQSGLWIKNVGIAKNLAVRNTDLRKNAVIVSATIAAFYFRLSAGH
jgi:hypothetical protein